jgi:hypothetical protein
VDKNGNLAKTDINPTTAYSEGSTSPSEQFSLSNRPWSDTANIVRVPEIGECIRESRNSVKAIHEVALVRLHQHLISVYSIPKIIKKIDAMTASELRVARWTFKSQSIGCLTAFKPRVISKLSASMCFGT